MESQKDEAALLEWVNSFPLNAEVHDLDGLHDGIWIWDMLRDIDPVYFAGNLPEGPSNSGKWVLRWQNLKHISRSLITYIVEERGQVLPKDYPMADLKTIASDSKASELLKAGLKMSVKHRPLSNADYTLQLLKLVLLAAINSPKTMEYVGRMQKLSVSTQARLKNIIQDVLTGDVSSEDFKTEIKRRSGSSKSGSDTSKHKRDANSSMTSVPDLELLFEERFGKIMAENNVHIREKIELQKDLRELHDRVVRLQDNNDALQERLTQAEDQLKITSSEDHASKESSIKQLEIKISRQENIIADQEVKLSDYETNTQALQRTIDKLYPSATTVQRLRDEIDEIKVERDSLAKKANTVERYKQKLHASQDLQKANSDLSKELDEIRGRFDAADEERQKVAGLQLRIKEYEKILPTLEQDRHELQLMKKQLEFENIDLSQRWNAANEQHALDQESIADLNDKLEELHRRTNSSSFPRSNDNVGNLGSLGNLDSELEKSSKDEEQLFKKISEFKAENEQLRASADNQGSKNSMLQQFLDQANEKLEEREKRYLEIFQEKLSLESSLESISQGDPIQKYTLRGPKVRNLVHNFDSTDVFRNTRDKLDAERKRNADLEAELVMMKSQLQEANKKSSLVDKDEQSGLQKVKGNESTALMELQQQNKQLNQFSGRPQLDPDDQKSLFPDANSGKKGFPENTSSTEEVKAALKEIAKAAAASAPVDANSASSQAFSKNVEWVTNMIMKDREQLARLAEHIKKQNAFINDLENRAREHQSNNGIHEDSTSTRVSNPKVSVAVLNFIAWVFANCMAIYKILSQQELIQNLERELKLMASAYHDLAGRLQMNNVLLQRRNEVPRSWLNKQRKLVDHSIISVGK